MASTPSLGLMPLAAESVSNREGLAIEVGSSIPAMRVIRVLSQLVALYGRPASTARIARRS